MAAGGGAIGGGGGDIFLAGFGGSSYLATVLHASRDNYGNGFVSINSVPLSAPEPSTWAIMLIGLAGLGVAGIAGSINSRAQRASEDRLSRPAKGAPRE